jgi:hypothetical protein
MEKIWMLIITAGMPPEIPLTTTQDVIVSGEVECRAAERAPHVFDNGAYVSVSCYFRLVPKKKEKK